MSMVAALPSYLIGSGEYQRAIEVDTIREHLKNDAVRQALLQCLIAFTHLLAEDSAHRVDVADARSYLEKGDIFNSSLLLYKLAHANLLQEHMISALHVAQSSERMQS